ncbi:hypothetical protein [Dyadobacter sp. NIV53]|uniref:hypothetical protein n=1 Tax=Dyadobacter sp. NIV53 TaxID=2861765 RepID=UPI001C886081|nr:hypothetical protein [Dyadobacter sp. NIV53]
MKASLLATFLTFILWCSTAAAQSRFMAKPGDKVWVFVNTVKADKRPQFEQFLHDIFWAGAKKLGEDDQKVFLQTRILHPTAAEADGTYSYLFIMDPVIEGGNYDIKSLLTKMYGDSKAEQYYKIFEDASVGEQKGYRLTQSKD